MRFIASQIKKDEKTQYNNHIIGIGIRLKPVQEKGGTNC